MLDIVAAVGCPKILLPSASLSAMNPPMVLDCVSCSCVQGTSASTSCTGSGSATLSCPSGFALEPWVGLLACDVALAAVLRCRKVNLNLLAWWVFRTCLGTMWVAENVVHRNIISRCLPNIL